MLISTMNPNKRPREGSNIERPRKTRIEVVNIEDDEFEEPKLFQFRILLPNGTTVELKMSELRNEMPIKEFIDVLRKEYQTVEEQIRFPESKRRINWQYQDLHFTDAHSNKIRIKVNCRDFMPNKWHFLWLHDGSAEPDVYKGMWDLTPDTDLLREIPDNYTFVTAIADLIDNSLQAVWSNGVGERRLISVELHTDRISIFDSGPGMDGTDGNLVKWGKMGASLHRSVRAQAIGGEPSYLMPFFGMFGYGGPVATMCLGRRAVVSSKTKNCSKVFTLHLEREALVSTSYSENCWKTEGGVRYPSEDEKKNSPHGSFTKVEIFEPKVNTLDIKRLHFKLKDIYFPYIQCDEFSGKTSTPIKFQVNGEDLAIIQGGEVAITNLYSCHGPDFILQLHFFSVSQDSSSMAGQSQRVFLRANARLKCVYCPIVEGEESIEKIIDTLEKDGCGIRESYESFSRVSVRRLGRLLPDTRWAMLPFMEPKQKKGEKAQILKRICSRVKCFIDTDSGFNPTPDKTDLAQHHPYTRALKKFGNRSPENEKEVQVEIFRDGRKSTLPQLEKQYSDWLLEMHDRYDEEIDGGLDQPTVVILSSKIKRLCVSSDVLTVHKKIWREGEYWSSGQKIKILKGACTGCHKNNVYATLDYIIFEGLPEDACGEGRLICRPLGLQQDRGCRLLVDNGNNTIDLRDALVVPIRVIDSGKCVPVDDIEWGKKLERYSQKLPSAIDLVKQETSSPQCSNRYVLPINSTPALKTPKLEHTDAQNENRIIWSQVSAPPNLGNFAESPSIFEKELEDDIVNSGMIMFDHESKLKRLIDDELLIQQHISDLQGFISSETQIMRGNGLASLGHREPEILFPVRNNALSPKTLQTSALLEARKSELVEINKQIAVAKDSYERAKAKFVASRDKYNSYLSRTGSSSAVGSSGNHDR